jgi:membrane-associated protein
MNSPWVGLNFEHLTDDGRVYAYWLPFLQIKRYAVDKSRLIYPSWADTLTPKMNLFDAHSIVSTLGLIGVLGIIFMETGLLIGLVFPGGEVVYLAGIAASGSGAALLGEAKLSAPLLFALAPIAAITGGEVGYWFGKKYGRAFFERPNTKFFNIKMVETIEKWLIKYGPRKALIFGRFIPFARTLINPICGVVQLERRIFSTWNAIGAIIWTQVAIGIGYLLGDAVEGSINKYLYPVIALIVLISLIPLVSGFLKERKQQRK